MRITISELKKIISESVAEIVNEQTKPKKKTNPKLKAGDKAKPSELSARYIDEPIVDIEDSPRHYNKGAVRAARGIVSAFLVDHIPEDQARKALEAIGFLENDIDNMLGIY